MSKSKSYPYLHQDCNKIHCIDRIKMLNWKDKTIPKFWNLGKKNIKGIIKCNNPNCCYYFDFIDYENSKEFQESD